MVWWAAGGLAGVPDGWDWFVGNGSPNALAKIDRVADISGHVSQDRGVKLQCKSVNVYFGYFGMAAGMRPPF